jgi:hypothetical protein
VIIVATTDCMARMRQMSRKKSPKITQYRQQ